MQRNKRLKSQKYNRFLTINPVKTVKENFKYETDRYHHLKYWYEKMTGTTYQNEAVDKNWTMNLQDIACSKQAFEKFANYFRFQYEKRRKEEILEQEDKVEDIKEDGVIANKEAIKSQIKKDSNLTEDQKNELYDVMDKVDEMFGIWNVEVKVVNIGDLKTSEKKEEKPSSLWDFFKGVFWIPGEVMFVDENEEDEEGEEENEVCDHEKCNEFRQIKDIHDEAFELMLSRNEKYWDSWKVLNIQSLANLCEMKLHRIANLDKLEPKVYDEFIDVLNYMAFWLLKLKNGEKK